MCYFVTLLPLVRGAENFEGTGTASRPTSKCKRRAVLFLHYFAGINPLQIIAYTAAYVQAQYVRIPNNQQFL